MMRHLLFGILVLAVSLGCGPYSFRPGGKATIQSLAVERFDNRTAEYGLEDRITNVVIDAFIADGTIKILPADGAEALLSASLAEYRREPHEFDENDQVIRLKVTMSFDVSMAKSADGSSLWTQRITQSGIYDAAEETEEDGQSRAIELLVDAIIAKTTESW